MISKTSDDRFSVFIHSENLVFTYILDEPLVRKGEIITEAKIIGKLKNESRKDILSADGLILLVSKNGHYIDAKRFITYK